MGRLGSSNSSNGNHAELPGRVIRELVPPRSPVASLPGAQHMYGVPTGKSPDTDIDIENANGTFCKGKAGAGKTAMNDKSNSTVYTHTGEESFHPDDCPTAPCSIPLESDHFVRRLDDKKRDLVIPIVLMVFIAAMAIIIPTAVILSRKESAAQQQPFRPPNNVTLYERPNITLEELNALIPGLSEGTVQRINDNPTTGPQALALQWVKIEPYGEWDSFPDWRKMQRYAMAVLFHSTGGPGWIAGSEEWLSHHLHECDWMRRSRLTADLRVMCNSEQRLVRVFLPSKTYFRGALPPEMEYLDSLEELDIPQSTLGKNLTQFFSNFLLQDDDSTPGDLSKYLPAIKNLQMADTMLTGTIPSQLGTLTTLQHLNLSHNDLSGSIPSQLGLLTQLETLDLSQNELTGTLPIHLGDDLIHLDNFNIEGNQLEEVGTLGLCNRPLMMTQLKTDWCQSPEQCCP